MVSTVDFLAFFLYLFFGRCCRCCCCRYCQQLVSQCASVLLIAFFSSDGISKAASRLESFLRIQVAMVFEHGAQFRHLSPLGSTFVGTKRVSTYFAYTVNRCSSIRHVYIYMYIAHMRIRQVCHYRMRW